MVRMLSKDELYEVSNNIKFTYHAIDRLNVRLDLDVEVYGDRVIIMDLIRNSCLAYYNTDGSINVGINEFEYFVFIPKSKYSHTYYLMITFKERSLNNITLQRKYELACKGVSR